MTEQVIISLGDVQDIVDQHKQRAGALLPVLHAIQQRFGFIPKSSITIIAKTLNLSRAEVHGVISFYHYFRTEQAGEHVLYVCRAEACQSMGSAQLEEKIKSTLGIDYHQTSESGVTLESVYCLGNCACSPNVRLNDRVVGRMNETKLDALLATLLEVSNP